MSRSKKELQEHEIDAVSPLELLEADEGGDGVFNRDGTVNVCVVRPGQATGKGNRIYTREMLARDADAFTRWPMFENHESPRARRERGHLPRSPADLRGELIESHWDDDFTTPDDAKLDYDKGAVVGKAMPTKSLRELLETIPRALKLSIRAFATDFVPGTYRGRKAELVEGIDREVQGSVDVVTKAGAGGHVLALQESGYDREHGEAERALEDLDDEDLVHHVGQHRPHLLPLIESAVDGADDDGERELEETEMGEIDTKALEEAAAKGATTALTTFLAGDDFTNAVKGIITPLVEAEVATATDETRELLESQSVPRRQVELRDLREFAHERIKASKLPEPFIEDLLLRYGLEEADNGTLHARPSLDITAELDDKQEVVKSARKVLEEALDGDIKREREKLAAANPTRVRGQGAATSGDGERSRERSRENGRELEEGADAGKPRRPLTGWRAGVSAAGVDVSRMAELNRSGRE